MALQTISTGRNRRSRQTAEPFSNVPALPNAQAEVLKRWLKSHANERTWQSLLEKAGRDHLDTAHALLQNLLETGVVQVKQIFKNAQWWDDRVVWRDLPRLQSAFGVQSADERSSERQELKQQFRALTAEAPWATSAAESCTETELPLATLRSRHELLRGLCLWETEQRFGVRQDFSLFARPHTKAISKAEWDWLEANLSLEDLRIARFQPVLWLGGALGLQGPKGQTDVGMLGFVCLPAKSFTSPLAVTRAPTHYWLLENRASFERNAINAAPSTCVIWLPGRPSQDWLTAMGWLLDQAPAPAEISCDPDPAGIEIALTAGELWRQRGLPRQSENMAPVHWQNAKTTPLNLYDQQTLERLKLRSDLPADLKMLCEFLSNQNCKAEQEGWL